MTAVADGERAALIATLRAVGPDALLGIGVPPLAARRHRIERRFADQGWQSLVDTLAAGPPLYSPLRWSNRVANIHEIFVHHEDIRRAVPGWTPRTLDQHADAALRRLTRVFAPVCMPGVPARVTLRTGDGVVASRVGRGPDVTVSGAPGELLLFAFGRDEIVVDFDGDPAVVDSVRQAKRRF